MPDYDRPSINYEEFDRTLTVSRQSQVYASLSAFHTFVGDFSVDACLNIHTNYYLTVTLVVNGQSRNNFLRGNHCFSDMFGNTLSQNIIVYTQCIITITCIFTNKNWLLESLVFSLITQILRSISLMCSLAAVVLILTRGTKSLIGSNSLSIMHR